MVSLCCNLCYKERPLAFFGYMKRAIICNNCCINKELYIRCSCCGIKEQFSLKPINFFKGKTQCIECIKMKQNKQIPQYVIPEHFCILCSYESDDKEDFESNYRICNNCCSTRYKRKCSKCTKIKWFYLFGKHNTKCLNCIYTIYIEQNEDEITDQEIQIYTYKELIKEQYAKKHPNKEKIAEYKAEIEQSKNLIYNLKKDNKKHLIDMKNT